MDFDERARAVIHDCDGEDGTAMACRTCIAAALRDAHERGVAAERERATKERRFPVMASRGPVAVGSVPWSIAEEAYMVYAARYGNRQSLERLAERGGFSEGELDELRPGWRPVARELDELRAAIRTGTGRAGTRGAKRCESCRVRGYVEISCPDCRGTGGPRRRTQGGGK